MVHGVLDDSGMGPATRIRVGRLSAIREGRGVGIEGSMAGRAS